MQESNPDTSKKRKRALNFVYNTGQVRNRKRISEYQYEKLESAFRKNKSPDLTERIRLAEIAGMTPREVQVWFQNRRAKERGQEARKQTCPDIFDGGYSDSLESLSGVMVVGRRRRSVGFGEDIGFFTEEERGTYSKPCTFNFDGENMEFESRGYGGYFSGI